MFQPTLFDTEPATQTSFLEDAWMRITPTITDPVNTYIILPGVRAGLFYKNLYKTRLNKSVILPNIITIYNFIDKFSPYQTLDTTAALFELYHSYRDIQTEGTPESFPEFYKWARLLLNDFNEIDNYLVDPAHLYSNLRNLKEMDEWSFAAEILSDSQENFITFWDKLLPLYLHFDGQLKKRMVAYSGKKVRWFSDELETFLEQQPDIRCHFLGFNALNRAEERIIETLCQEGKADIYWDIDDYYHNNPDQEAGKFFPARDSAKNHHFLSGRMLTHPLQVDLIGVPKSVGQVKTAAQILQEIPAAEMTETAVVLANESLLVPLLNSIPESVPHINLTMGLPLKHNPLYLLLESLFEFNADDSGDDTVATTVVRKLVTHPLLSAHFSEHPGIAALLIKKRYVRKSAIRELCATRLDLILFGGWENDPARVLASLNSLIGELRERNTTSAQGQMENEFLFELAKTLVQLEHVVSKNPELVNVSLLKKLLFDELGRIKVAFIGEPLKGLQIMGMLETRALDFKNLVVLGANEGIMPAAATDSSLIPNDLKKYYGLPTHEKREAIYAYYVYRLLHRSSRVTFIYNNVIDQLGGSEMSRFLLQLSEELPSANPAAVVRMMSAEGSFGSEVTGVFAVEKTAEMIEKIKNLLKSGLSPTALNTLIRCPLNFYYKYILGVGELEDPDEEVSASEFGTLVHRALELLYADMDGKPVTFAFLAEAKKQVDSAIHTALNEQMAEPRPEGKLLLSLELAKFQVQRLLDLEKSRITRLGNSGTALIYMGSEQTLSYETVVDLEQESIPLVFKGKIDRIEKTGNTIWVIDYKTGAVEAADLSVRSWDQLKNATKSKALQLAVYGLALNRRYPGMELKSGIVSTISPQEEPLSLKIEGKEVVYTSAEEAIITEVLTDVIREVLTMELPFVHDPKSNYCAYCHG